MRILIFLIGVLLLVEVSTKAEAINKSDMIVCEAGFALGEESNKCESVCNLKEERWDTKQKKCIKHKCGHGFKQLKGKCVEIVCEAGYALSETGKEC